MAYTFKKEVYDNTADTSAKAIQLIYPGSHLRQTRLKKLRGGY